MILSLHRVTAIYVLKAVDTIGNYSKEVLAYKTLLGNEKWGDVDSIIICEKVT